MEFNEIKITYCVNILEIFTDHNSRNFNPDISTSFENSGIRFREPHRLFNHAQRKPER